MVFKQAQSSYNIVGTVDTSKFDLYARWSFEQFVLNQPHITTKGLYRSGLNYYIVCPELTPHTLALDGTGINDWFQNHKEIISPICLVKECPPNAEKISERTHKQLIEGGGSPKTLRDFFSDLLLSLPKEFPKFILRRSDKPFELYVVTEKELSEKEYKLLETTLLNLEHPFKYHIIIDDEVKSKSSSFRFKYTQGDIDLIPSKLFPYKTSTKLKELLEEDEDFWIKNRFDIFSGKILSTTSILPKLWKKHEARCIIDASVFPRYDIRNYLSVYDNIIIAPPLLGKEHEILPSLGVSLEELVELTRMHRVNLIFPQSVDRYSLRLLEMLVDSSPESLIFSRKLASLAIIDTRNRFPFLYPPFGIEERRILLSLLYLVSKEIRDDTVRSLIESLTTELGRIWSNAENLVHYRGAMATPALGLAPIISSLIKTSFGRDRFLEFLSAASLVEWGAPFNASLCPISLESGYSEEIYTEILANAYTGIKSNTFLPLFIRRTSKILGNILSINSSIPVLDFAQTFKSSDITRLRKLIFKLSLNTSDLQNYEEIIEKFNREVKSYESNIKRLSELNIIGFIQAASGLIATLVSTTDLGAGIGLASVPLTIWLLQRLNKDSSENKIISYILDNISAFTTGTSPGAVLVVRLKKQLQSK